MKGTIILLIYLVLVILILSNKKAINYKEKLLKLSKSIIPCLIMFLLFSFYKHLNAVPIEASYADFSWNSLARIPFIAGGFLAEMFLSGNWNVIWFLRLISLLNCRKIKERKEAQILIIALMQGKSTDFSRWWGVGAKAPRNQFATNEVGGMMDSMKKEYRKSPHAVYEIKYHFVFCPKYRYCVLEGKMKARLEEMISEICESMEILIIEGQISKGHVHMCLSVPPRYSPAEVMKRIKGNSSERIFREFPGIKKRYWGQHFWVRGYFVSTVGIDEETI